MITLNNYGDNANRMDSLFWGLSTDTKPTKNFNESGSSASVPIENGSILIEMDTKKVFVYDRENAIWREFA